MIGSLQISLNHIFSEGLAPPLMNITKPSNSFVFPLTLLQPSLSPQKPYSLKCRVSLSAAAINAPLQRESSNKHDEEEMYVEEDGRNLHEIWEKIQGSKDWEGLLEPMNSHLRREIIRYGEFAQACYDSFDFDPHSKYCGTCKYDGAQFFEKLGMADRGYRISRYLYATSNINLPNFFQHSSVNRIWSQHANWMGYVAVATDEAEIRRLGRRDIVIAWRGTVTYLEWIHDLKNILHPAHFRDDPDIKIESGFFDLYTNSKKDDSCNFCSYSAREQLLAEVNRLIERYKGENLSITVTGHSLGAALALLSAYDIAEMKLNVVHQGQGEGEGETSSSASATKIPVSVFSFAGPRVGNLRFKERCDELGIKVLRIVNVRDKVPTVPGIIANEKFQYQKQLETTLKNFPWSYAHVGVELALDHSHSPFLKTGTDLGCAHNLEGHLHLVDGYHGQGRRFRSATGRDIALVNKDSNFLKREQGVPPRWRQDENKGMVRTGDGRWVVPERSRIEAHPPDTGHHFRKVLRLARARLHLFEKRVHVAKQ
nr:phospholipase A1-Igamma3, chloroplastic-like [Ipomoea batatas]